MVMIREMKKRLPNCWPLAVEEDPRVADLPDIVDTLLHVMDCCARRDECIGAHPSELTYMLRDLADRIERLTDLSLPVD